MKLKDIPITSNVVLKVSTEDKSLELKAVILDHLKNDITSVSLVDYQNKKLSFDRVTVDLEYKADNNSPYLFRNVTVKYVKGVYFVISSTDGVKLNRRNYFRVPVGVRGTLKTKHISKNVIIKDVSMSGFGITDRNNELDLSEGAVASIKFVDLALEMCLEGELVRVERTDDYTIYGFKIINICKDLQYYIGLKQRKKN